MNTANTHEMQDQMTFNLYNIIKSTENFKTKHTNMAS